MTHSQSFSNSSLWFLDLVFNFNFMTFLIQFLGCILNIYLVFLLTSQSIFKSFISPNNIKTDITIKNNSLNNQYWLKNTHFNQNRLELFYRISLLLLFCYFITELDFFYTSYNIHLLELSLLDGIIKITKTKSLIFICIFFITSLL